MSIELIRGELERLYSLEEMLALSGELLGFEPGIVGGTASSASFARALTDHCAKNDAIAALVDAVTGTKDKASPKLQKFVDDVLRSAIDLKAGTEIGPFKVVRKLGAGPNGSVYTAKHGDRNVVLKLLHNAAVHDRSALYRFLTRNRMITKAESDHLPSNVQAGFVDGKAYVAYTAVDGKPLAPRIARTGALHINEARALLYGILNALQALHAAGTVHGALKLENVIIGKGEDGSASIVLVDAGGDLLRSSWVHSDVGTGGGDRIKGMAPEQLRGLGTTPASDMYGFGAMLFEVLTGKPPLSKTTATDTAVAHLSERPPAANALAPKGWVSEDLTNLCELLLDKDPKKRPTIDKVLGVLGPVEKAKDAISAEELDECVDALVADPTDVEAAIALETTLERKADAGQVADAFTMAADQIDPEDMSKEAREGEASTAIAEVKAEAARDRAIETKKSLLFRAARLYEQKKQDPAKAEATYKWVLELDDGDEVAQTGYQEALKQQEKYEELVEHLLLISEESDSHADRARALNKIGHIYANELEDTEQAVFAFSQALAQDVQSEEYAADLERHAGDNMNYWAETMQTLHQVSEHPRMPDETRMSLFMRLGTWYTDKIQRPDLAVRCFESVLTADPAHQAALEGMTTVYRRAQQWNELVQILLTRVQRAPTPEQGRDLRTEAAEILDTRLDDLGRARDLYEENLKEDPGHQKTVDALASIYTRNEDPRGLVKILEKQAEALTGRLKAEAMCQIGELYEDQLNDLPEAERRYMTAMEVDPGNMSAIRGLDRVFNRTGRYKELLENLERQVNLAATPRQKINLFNRIAGIYDEEFLDHEKSAEFLEKILELDPGHEGAMTELMRHYRALDRWDDVIELYDRSLRVCAEDARRVQLLLAQGRVLLDFGSPERARLAYENILQIEPSNNNALEALAQVRAATGDAMAALSAVESLAEKATDPTQKAERWIRAARILEEHGDKDGAIVRYKKALDAQSDNAEAGVALRGAYLARGDAQSAVDLIAKEIEGTDGELARARLHTELAQLKQTRLNDTEGARKAALKSLDLDPTNVGALLLLGDAAFETENYNEAVTRLGSLAGRSDVLEKDDAKRMLMRYIDSLARTGSTKKAIDNVKTLLALAPGDPEAMRRAARVHLDAEDGEGAAKLFAELRENHAEDLEDADKAELLLNHGKSLRLSGKLDEALEPLNEAADLAPEKIEPIQELSAVFEAKGDWEEVVRIKQRRLDVAEGEERGKLLLEIGEVYASEVKDATKAAKTFVAALEERPNDRRVLTRLMKLYSEEKDWGKLIDVVLKLGEGVDDPAQKVKYVQTAAGVASRQLEDYDAAIKYLDMVLELDPGNAKAVADSIENREKKGDLDELIAFLLKLAEEANDKKTKVGYVEDAAKVAAAKKGDLDQGIELYDRVLALDGDHMDALQQAIDLREQKHDHEGVVFHLNIALEKAEKSGNDKIAVKILDKIGKIYLEELKATDEAVVHFERAQKLDPENASRTQKLADLYAGDTEQYLAKAVQSQLAMLQNNPFTPEVYRTMRRLYTEAKQADPAWLVCQALYVMNTAEPDEERFFRRMRADTAAEARERANLEDWKTSLMHPTCDPLVTTIFQLIEPAVLSRNARPLEELGYQQAYALDLAMHPYPISQTLFYAGGVLGMDIPMTFQNPNDPGGISFLHARPPCVVLGATALAAELPTQAAAFIAARHLTYYREGLYIRHLVPTGTGMRAWLFAAIRLIHEAFPVAAELETTVNENLASLRSVLTGPSREQLASTVSKLLQSGAIDLKKWVSGVDLSADRAGFLVAHDLEVACEMIKASDEAAAAVSHRDRVKELTLFSVSPAYFRIRQRLGISIDS
jgi:tetratricopeptide (TPR) repeat protein